VALPALLGGVLGPPLNPTTWGEGDEGVEECIVKRMDPVASYAASKPEHTGGDDEGAQQCTQQ